MLRSSATQRPVRSQEPKLSNYSCVVQATTYPIMSGLAHQVNSNGELARAAPSSNTPCAIGPDGDLAEETRTWPAALREARSFCKQASERVKSELVAPLDLLTAAKRYI